MIQQFFWYNGELIQGSTLEMAIDDPGLLYGATVFTTLRVYGESLDEHLTAWQAHCDRLQTTLSTFAWNQPNWQKVRQGAETLIQFFPVLRIAVFPDGREWITGRFLPKDLTERQQLGITAWVADAPEFQRALPHHKTGNYLPAWMALRKATALGASEAILVDAAGNWLETSTGNLWGWRDNQWWTPPLESEILPGVMRSQLIDWLFRHNRSVGEVIWDAQWVQGLEAIAYSNSVITVVPIRDVLHQNHHLTYNPFHPALEELRSLFQPRI